MNFDLLLFFDRMPGTLPLYEAIAEKIDSEYKQVSITVKKTCISFGSKCNFAYVSLPTKRWKGCSAACIILTLGLGRQVVHPRIAYSIEPYPNRWTHHIMMKSKEEVDEQLMDWIKEAYFFSLTK